MRRKMQSQDAVVDVPPFDPGGWARMRKLAREQFVADVAVMRDLSVLEWNGIKLGPEPSKPPREATKEEIAAKADREMERRHAIIYGATIVRPPLPKRG